MMADHLVNPVNRLSTSSEEEDAISKTSSRDTGYSYNHQAKAERHHILMNIVGETKYDEILIISEEIKDIRHKSAFWTKFSRSCANSREVQVQNYKGTYNIEQYTFEPILLMPCVWLIRGP